MMLRAFTLLMAALLALTIEGCATFKPQTFADKLALAETAYAGAYRIGTRAITERETDGSYLLNAGEAVCVRDALELGYSGIQNAKAFAAEGNQVKANALLANVDKGLAALETYLRVRGAGAAAAQCDALAFFGGA